MGLKSDPGWTAVLLDLTAGLDIGFSGAEQAMSAIMSGDTTDAQIGAFLVAMRAKGESAEEMAGMVTAMLAASTAVVADGPLLDTCGTGGDRKGTMNVSTCAAFVAAGAGIRVAKHGNRAASSQCGSADLLEAMGVEIELSPAGVRRCIDEAGIGFIYARSYHPAMRFVAGPRSELGIPTVMNSLGPLSNPARASRRALGVARPEMAAKMAEVLRMTNVEHALVFYGHDGLDELSISGPSTVIELIDGETTTYEIFPEEIGITHAPPEAISGGDVLENVRINAAVLAGESGPPREVVVMNAAAGIVASGLADDLAAGVGLARESIDSGRAAAAAETLISVSRAEADR